MAAIYKIIEIFGNEIMDKKERDIFNSLNYISTPIQDVPTNPMKNRINWILQNFKEKEIN